MFPIKIVVVAKFHYICIPWGGGEEEGDADDFKEWPSRVEIEKSPISIIFPIVSFTYRKRSAAGAHTVPYIQF